MFRVKVWKLEEIMTILGRVLLERRTWSRLRWHCQYGANNNGFEIECVWSALDGTEYKESSDWIAIVARKVSMQRTLTHLMPPIKE